MSESTERPLAFRAEVKHVPGGKGCIISYFDTMAEAIKWLSRWRAAVEAHVVPVR